MLIENCQSDIDRSCGREGKQIQALAKQLAALKAGSLDPETLRILDEQYRKQAQLVCSACPLKQSEGATEQVRLLRDDSLSVVQEMERRLTQRGYLLRVDTDSGSNQRHAAHVHIVRGDSPVLAMLCMQPSSTRDLITIEPHNQGQAGIPLSRWRPGAKTTELIARCAQRRFLRYNRTDLRVPSQDARAFYLLER